jgi:glycerophosphoryl diester phosphodiesterase
MLYPALLACLRLLVGATWLPLAAALLGLGAHGLASACVARLADRLWGGRAAGTLALALYGLNPVLLHFALEPLDATVALALCLAGLTVAGLGLARPPAARRVAGGALLLGLAALARPHFLPVLLVAPVALALPALGGVLPWRRAALVWLGGGACLLLFGALNLRVGGEFRLLPWQGAFNLYAANRAGADGRYFTQEAFVADLAPGVNPARAEAEMVFARATGAEPPFAIAAQNRFWRERFIQTIRADPLGFAALQARKLYYLGNDFEPYNNKTYAYHKARAPLLRWNPLGWGVLLALAAGALAWQAPWPRALRGWLLIGAAYAAGMGLYFISARFRIPLVPVLVVCAAGWGPVLAATPWRGGMRARGRRLDALAAMALAGLLAWSPFFGARDTATFVQDEILLANAAAEAGADAQALAFARAALARDPARQDALRILLLSAFNLALDEDPAFAAAGGWAALGEAAARFQPWDPAGCLVAGVARWNNGEQAAAQAVWQAAVQNFGPAADNSRICLALIGADGADAVVAATDPAVAATLRRLLRLQADAATVLFAGHRGYSARYPENTLRSMRACLAAGAHGIEMDVRATADGVIVVCHDARVDRITNGTGRVDELTWESISRLDAGAWKAPEFAGEGIPRFAAVLDAFRDSSAMLLIELKADVGEEVVALIGARGMQRQCIVRSFSLDRIDRVKALAPDIRTQLIHYETEGWREAMHAAAAGGHAITLHVNQVTAEKVAAAHAAGLVVYVSTVDELDRIRELVDMGVDGIIGNHVDRLLQVQREQGLRQPSG